MYTLKRLRRSRRALAFALAASVAAMPFPALLSAQEATVQTTADGFAVGPQQLQSAAESQFPREESLLGGLAELTFSKPAVAIPTPGDRIQLDLDYALSLKLDGREDRGRLRVASGLRYDPGTRGLHLQNPEVLDVKSASGAGQIDAQTRSLISALLQDYAKDEPLYRLDAEMLAQVPGTLGADAIRIENGQVRLKLHP